MKSELQKMLADELYDASDPQLVEMRDKARRLFYRYNRLSHDATAEKYLLLKELLGSMGQKINIEAPFYCDYGVHIHVGENFFMNFNGIILDCAEVFIGDNVAFGPNVQLYAAYHPLDAAERIKGPELAAPIRIGDNVWLGGGVIVCQGVTIGANTTIGAGAVVTKDIPANVFAAGNPCRVIRHL
ncbi:MAG: sugar O-acetyltransferase [Bacteroidota bacterium]